MGLKSLFDLGLNDPCEAPDVVYVNSIYPLGSAQIVNLKNGDCLSGTHSALSDSDHVLQTQSRKDLF